MIQSWKEQAEVNTILCECIKKEPELTELHEGIYMAYEKQEKLLSRRSFTYDTALMKVIRDISGKEYIK